MFNLIETVGRDRCKRATFATFAEAVAHAHASFEIIDFEEDADYPGCADFYTASGTLYAIEPA